MESVKCMDLYHLSFQWELVPMRLNWSYRIIKIMWIYECVTHIGRLYKKHLINVSIYSISSIDEIVFF